MRLLACMIALAACREAAVEPVAITHEAYVWQRNWTGAVREAVSAAPVELTGLRVLALEVEPARPLAGQLRPVLEGETGQARPIVEGETQRVVEQARPVVEGETEQARRVVESETGEARPVAEGVIPQVWPAVSVEALAATHRPVTAVVRIDGSRPIVGLSLEPLLRRLEAWRRAGVDVVGIEIDHDCATAALADYAAWLRAARPPAPLRWSITALPTWAGSAQLPRVAAAVDELVVQVHAVRTPSLFDARQARRWVDEFAGAIAGTPFRVAVPTYRVVIASTPRDADPTREALREVDPAVGTLLEADPAEVAGFVGQLAHTNIANLRGVVWFRLPVASDVATWRLATLRAVIAGEALAPAVAVRAIRRGSTSDSTERFDLVLANTGTLDARFPGVRLSGADTVDLVAGYRGSGETWAAPARTIAAGSELVIGWATGKDLDVETN